jgi:hypothetical protein
VKHSRFSIFLLSALASSTLLGIIVGFSFWWAAPERAWDHLIAGFLWVMLIAVGTGLARSVRERIQRGEWRRGLAVGCEMTFPPVTLYMLAVALVSLGAAEVTILTDGTNVVSRPDMLAVAPIFYGVTMAVAVFIGPVYMLTSPFGVKSNQ